MINFTQSEFQETLFNGNCYDKELDVYYEWVVWGIYFDLFWNSDCDTFVGYIWQPKDDIKDLNALYSATLDDMKYLFKNWYFPLELKWRDFEVVDWSKDNTTVIWLI